MKLLFKITFYLVILLFSVKQYGQHHSELKVTINDELKLAQVVQKITYNNETKDTLNQILLNDWNNSYSEKNTPLARRFSDEFSRSFHLAKNEERGNTALFAVIDQNNLNLNWKRPEKHPDLVQVQLKNPIYPGHQFTITVVYTVKLPHSRFTKYGYSDNGTLFLKNWFLTPAIYEDHKFLQYSNENLDDIANAISNFTVTLKLPQHLELTTDLNFNGKTIDEEGKQVYELTGKNRNDIGLILEPKSTFSKYKNDILEVETNLKDNRINEIQKAMIIDKVVRFVNQNIGHYPNEKIIISQVDYDRNPFYGLNQLPAFISPFSDEYLYEVQFLKTYLNNYLKNSLHLNPRKDNWIYDGIQVYTMMKYINEYYPDSKMMGNVSKFKLLKGYMLTSIGFNEQYSYLYMLMARKNLDQPIGDPKNTFIKFNEQIAGKYRAGLSLNYLDKYLEHDIVKNSIQEFYGYNLEQHATRVDFESILKNNTDKDIRWFFDEIINTRNIIDYKFGKISKTKDSITVTLRNNTETTVPISLYGVKNDSIVFKKWFENIKKDSTFTVERHDADKVVINYNKEVPEYNLRNNWKSLRGFIFNNRPLKFNFLKDLEDPYYNQVFYVPVIGYNLYDGVSPGIRLHNKSILDKPFQFDIAPTYSTKTSSITGNINLLYNQYIREGGLYNIRYSLGTSYFHYAPDATYLKFNPMVQFRIRENNFRDNKKQLIQVRYVSVIRDATTFSVDSKNEDYSVFNARYSNTATEVTKHFNLTTDLQIANAFGKISAEIEYRKLFENNRQVNFRLFAGSFMYRSTNSDFFSFALDRPTDYLFDYNYYGRSESTGLFSQQLIIADGGFKSKLDTPYANQWIVTANGSFNIWNWVELYGDVGTLKNKFDRPKFVYDSGIRLNLVTDYFELYFPIYSNNGWEIAQPNYNERIRFIVTISPKTLINLFTRKWL
ncbi:aminopeptidase [Flavobacterium sp. '19STA2R22 D10 B1']|uniref:aminopeptidase n=1 Tax=Flavobacterium aerium TaxID=3037261 RepID=UPI00278C5099|nr:aminopeptidase [Flavobacterium sp. '19STA2R22 D10 B1']